MSQMWTHMNHPSREEREIQTAERQHTVSMMAAVLYTTGGIDLNEAGTRAVFLYGVVQTELREQDLRERGEKK